MDFIGIVYLNQKYMNKKNVQISKYETSTRTISTRSAEYLNKKHKKHIRGKDKPITTLSIHSKHTELQNKSDNKLLNISNKSNKLKTDKLKLQVKFNDLSKKPETELETETKPKSESESESQSETETETEFDPERTEAEFNNVIHNIIDEPNLVFSVFYFIQVQIHIECKFNLFSYSKYQLFKFLRKGFHYLK